MKDAEVLKEKIPSEFIIYHVLDTGGKKEGAGPFRGRITLRA